MWKNIFLYRMISLKARWRSSGRKYLPWMRILNHAVKSWRMKTKRWRFVAKLEDGKGSVSLQEVDSKHPFYGLEGSNNIILLTTERYKEYPMMIQGYGAGASVTAAGVFADIMSIANI